MLEKYFYAIAIYTAIIATINSAYEVQQHDITGEDGRSTIDMVFKDSYSNMKELQRRNFTINGINFKDDENVKFNEIISNWRQPHNQEITVKCIINNTIQVTIQLGNYEATGSFGKSNKIYPFEMQLSHVNVIITIHANNTENTEIEIQGIKIYSRKPDTDETTAILNAQIPAIKSQISDHFFALIKKEDLLSHFSTAKNYCFHSPTQQYYFINQSLPLDLAKIKPPNNRYQNFTLEWIKIHNFHINFTFVLGDSDGLIFSLQNNQGTEFTFGGYYVANDTNSKKSTEFHGKLGVMIVEKKTYGHHVEAGVTDLRDENKVRLPLSVEVEMASTLSDDLRAFMFDLSKFLESFN